MMPVALFSLLIVTEDRRLKTETPNYQLCPFIFLALLPTGKVADNHKV